MTTGLRSCITPAWNLRFRLIFVLLLMVILSTVPLQVSAGSTEIRVVKYAVDEFTVLTEKTVGYTWMEQNLRVYGDGVTHYYLQGPVFVDDPDPVREEELRWDPSEDTNVQEKDMGAVKGSSLRDLCNLVGGMVPGDRAVIQAADGFRKEFAYENIYEPSSRQGEMVITWWKGGEGYVPSYRDGMRLVFFADTGTNPWGIHAMGNWDWHESADEDYWYYYYNGNEKYPTTTGLSVRDISDIIIFSKEEPSGSINVTSAPDGADVYLDGEDTGDVTPCILSQIPAGSYSVSVRKDGYLSPDETWIEISHGMVIPVHFTLEREYSTPHSGSGEPSPYQDSHDAGGQGFLVETENTIPGPVSVLIATGEHEICRSGQTLLYRITTDTRSSDQVLWARLYIFSERGYTSDQALEVRVNSEKTGFPDRSTYHHADGRVSETFAFNITRLIPGPGSIEVSVRNLPGGNDWTLYPPVLLVSGGNRNESMSRTFISEGAGFVNAMKEYSPQDLQNITITDFSEIPGGSVQAELRVVGTAMERADRVFPMVLQNSLVIPGEYEYDRDGIWVSRYNGTGTISGYIHNELFWKSSEPEKAGEFGPRVAIITLTYPAGSSPSEKEAANSPVVENVSIESTIHPEILTHPPGSVPITASSDVPVAEPAMTAEDDSFLSRIWRMILWISGIQLPDDATYDHSPRDDIPSRISDKEGMGVDADFANPSVTPSFSMYSLNVTTIPPGASVSLSGLTDVKTTPATFLLSPGDYLVETGMEGYIGCQTFIHLKEPMEVALTLATDDITIRGFQEEKPGRSRHGGIRIITYPGDLEISVDNKKIGSKSPHIIYGLKEGAHMVKAIRPSATAGKGESLMVKTWVYHDTLSISELDFVALRFEKTIRVTDSFGMNTPFALNGMYPLLRTPVTLEITRTGSFITRFGEGTYTSIPIPDHLSDGTEFSFPHYAGEYHSLLIESSPANAEIFIDGARTGNRTPFLVRGLSEGPHRIMVSMPGFESLQRVIGIPRTDDETIKEPLSFTLETYPCGPLRIESYPEGAAIYLDGLATGEKTPLSFSGIPVGIHELTLRSGDLTSTRDITIRPDNPNRFFIDLFS